MGSYTISAKVALTYLTNKALHAERSGANNSFSKLIPKWQRSVNGTRSVRREATPRKRTSRSDDL